MSRCSAATSPFRRAVVAEASADARIPRSRFGWDTPYSHHQDTRMIRRLIPLALAASIATPALAQQRQAAFNWQGVVAAGGDVSVNNINGDIKVTQSTTGRVEVVGFRTGDSQYADRIKVDVQPTQRGIVICVIYVDTDSYCDDRGYHSEGRGHNSDRDWGRLAIDLEVAIPSNLQVGASSVSG